MPSRINPTRMELSKLKKRLTSAVRGHKLLKDKQDEMIRQFMVYVKNSLELRDKINKAFDTLFKHSAKAAAIMGENQMLEALMVAVNSLEIDAEKSSIMGVEIPKISKDSLDSRNSRLRLPYSFLSSSIFLDKSIIGLLEIFNIIAKLAEEEKICHLLAAEIERSRRRVNALEHMMIPQLQKDIKYISAKLEDSERSNITRLMKVKELVLKERSN